MLRRDRWSTLAIALTLALGIGAATATFAVFNTLIFRTTPGVHGQSGILTVLFQPPSRTATAYGSREALEPLRQAATGLEHLAYFGSETLAVTTAGDAAPEFKDSLFVTSQFFSVIGARARVGRLLTDEEADTGTANVAVISERLWKARFGGTAGVLGQTLTVNGRPFTVAGVIADHRGWSWTSSRIGTIDLWLPIGLEKLVTGETGGLSVLYGRRRPGVSLEAIEQQLRAAYANVNLPARYHAFLPTVYPGINTQQAANTERTARRLYWLLMAGAALVLVLACANAANLLLARTARRAQETAVRLALGANRWRIVRSLLVESTALAAIANVLGLAVAIVLVRFLSDLRLLWWLPAIAEVDLDRRVLLFSAAVTSATVVGFGLAPALMASRVNVLGALGRHARGVAGPPRLRHALVIVQIAVSLTLLAGAGVLNRSLQRLFSVDLGVDTSRVVGLSLRPEDIGYDRGRSTRVISDTVTALERRGAGAVAMSSPGPLSSNGATIAVRTAGMAELTRKTVTDNFISPAFFDLLSIPFVSGRAFTEDEYRQPASVSPMPVILNETLARDLFPGQPSVGRTFELERYIGMASPRSMAVVVGVVRDTRSTDVRAAVRPALFHMRQSGYRWPVILVRGRDPEGVTMARIREVVREVDPALPITALSPLGDELGEALSQERVLARVSGLIALMATVLAATGVFAIVSQLVTARTRDFGIRTALGASAGNIVGHVLRGVLFPAALGLVAGAGLYWLASRWLETRLFEIRALDPVTFGAAAFVLLTIAMLGALLPARRAARVDPVIALRAD